MVWKQELSQEPSKGLGHRSPDSPERTRGTAATGPVWMLAVSLGRWDKAFVQTMVNEPAVIPSANRVEHIDRTSQSELNACPLVDGKRNTSLNCPRTFNVVDCGSLARSLRLRSKNRLFVPTLGDVATEGRQGEIPTSMANAHAFASILREALRRVRAVRPQPIVPREAMPVNILVHPVSGVLGWAPPRSRIRDQRRNSNVTRGLR
jgi:hypothetical protein